MKIDVRGAVVAAKKYFEDIQDMIGNSINDILLEEVELSENKQYWYVTLGFSRPVAKSERTLIPDVISVATKTEREYKIFTVDAETGEVKSMKIREV
ncbi:hypothetical protein PN483_18795 [Nodularia spumigena CS-591/04]|uniref:hypothetical protein n=1 Tax=Nodularia spumigena TaxID=70799 RepID=UPI00232B26D2|nr:hypothetical protein [Nodularia spumigena]MDB9323982.1 hypothetical protein [Nodularia spumigena CS-591/07A]MDB9332507.1 hypothetical protein [Nodularia spumigena CS-591/04]MDB9359720.1 hypothetical protein [Nodularia spumigena CS-588/02]MDB9365403.1 hypothetical protein [Nodularia spumigena CS-588/02A10]